MNIVCDPKRLIKSCRVCDSADLELFLDLGFQPWCGHFLREEEIGTEPFYPSNVLFCRKCSTPQISYTVPKEVMFSDHTYLSNITKTLSDHFKSVAEEADNEFFKNTPGKSILDIGSNDGMQLSHYKNLGYDVLGVESAKTVSKIANDAGIPTVNDFFNLDFVKRIGRKFNIINASGVFFHLEELHSAAEGIREALLPDGVFLLQFLYMRRIVENSAFDQIYHEHLLYYNLKNVEILLNLHGLSLFDAYLSPIHGGSIIGFAAHKGRREKSERLLKIMAEEEAGRANDFSTYVDFAKRIEQKKTENLSFLQKAKAAGKRIFGFSAPAKGNTLLNYFGIGTDYIDVLVEKNHLRRGLYSPGMHIPIVIEGEFNEIPDIYYMLAWNFKKELLAKNEHLIKNGVEFYFPVDPVPLEDIPAYSRFP